MTRAGRGQSNVVGVALLLAVTLLSMGALTAGVSSVVEQNAAAADVSRVADAFDATLHPVRTTGERVGTLAFADGHVHTVERDVRVLDGDGVVVHARANGLTFETGDRGVTFLAGAIVSWGPGWARVHRRPAVAAGEDILVVGLPVVDGHVSVGGQGGVEVRLRVRVEHDRRPLGDGRYRVAVETRTPGAWRRTLAARGATTGTSRDFDGDGVPSVVARFPGTREGYVVVHRVAVTVA